MFWLDGAEVWAGAGAGAKDVGITCMGGGTVAFLRWNQGRSTYVGWKLIRCELHFSAWEMRSSVEVREECGQIN